MKHYTPLFSWFSGQKPPRPFRTPGNKGFTLVELIVVTAVLGVLALMAIPFYKSYINKTKNARAMSEIRTLSTEIVDYSSDNGGNNPPDLGAPGINRLGFKDPWNHDYIYNSTPSLTDSLSINYNQDFDVYSLGADAATTVDDIIRSNDGSFIGLRAE